MDLTYKHLLATMQAEGFDSDQILRLIRAAGSDDGTTTPILASAAHAALAGTFSHEDRIRAVRALHAKGLVKNDMSDALWSSAQTDNNTSANLSILQASRVQAQAAGRAMVIAHLNRFGVELPPESELPISIVRLDKLLSAAAEEHPDLTIEMKLAIKSNMLRAGWVRAQ